MLQADKIWPSGYDGSMTCPLTTRMNYGYLAILTLCLGCGLGCRPTPSATSATMDKGESARHHTPPSPKNTPASKTAPLSDDQPPPATTVIPRVTLKGRFTFGGSPPAPRLIETNLAFCGKDKMQDESLIVDPYNRGVANVCIWLETDVPSVPASQPPETVTIYNENCQFAPHIVTLRVDQTLRIQNADPIGHILKIDGFQNAPVVANLPVKNTVEATFPAAERVPSIMTSSVYPWMRGYLIVKDHGFVATSQRDGTFEIRDLPAATLRFQVWHEKIGYVRRVTIGGAAADWKRGCFDLKLNQDVDLGDIVIAADLFAT